MAPRARAAIALAIAMAALIAAPGHTATQGRLQAGPTLLEVDTRVGATRLVLRNTGDAPVGVQVRVFAWSQPDGDDSLTPSDDFAVSPPISEIPAGGEQVVRLVRLAAVSTPRDRTYRVVAEELPRRAAEDGAEPSSTVTMRMRYVIPLFDRAAGASAPQVSCVLTSRAEDARLRCENTGGRAAQFAATRIADSRGHSATLSKGLFGYVLPGSHRTWPVPAAFLREASGVLRLETQVDGKPSSIPVGDGRP